MEKPGVMEPHFVGQPGREVAGPPESLPHHSAFCAYDTHFDGCVACERGKYRCAVGERLWAAWLELAG